MSTQTFLNGRVTLHAGNCLDVIKRLADSSIDSVVTDPPYALVSITKRFGKPGSAECKVGEGRSGAYARASAGFMGKAWDTGDVAFAVEFWTEVYRVLKPGGHVLAFGGTRTVHRLTCAIEDAGFEIRDMVAWLYGSGFPKSHDVAKGIDRAAGVARTVTGTETLANDIRNGALLDVAHGGVRPAYVRDVTVATSDAALRWDGWGTALKPALEPITVGRKPLAGTVAENVLAHGTGALNIAGCRVASDARPLIQSDRRLAHNTYGPGLGGSKAVGQTDLGRWPANLIHDGSEEVSTAFPAQDAVSAARFFYNAKADSDDRIGSKHPTVKPVDLMRYLVRLITPPGGTVLDPFAGTGTTGEAAFYEGFRAVLIEREEEYRADIARRMTLAMAGPDERKREIIKAKTAGKVDDLRGTLFGFTEAAE